MNIRIVTDSAADIAQNSYEKVSVVPMSVSFDDVEYQDGVTLSRHEFYEKLVESDELPHTSQPSPMLFQSAYEEALKECDHVLVVTVSSKLSGTYQSALIAAEDFPGKVTVFDSLSAAIGQRILVDEALKMFDKGASVEEVVAELTDLRGRVRILAMLNTLEYLKKGGRIPPVVAVAGQILAVKPVITVEDGLVSMMGSARGSKKANNFLMKKVEECGGIDFDRSYYLGYTGLSNALLQKYAYDSRQLWVDHVKELPEVLIGSAIGTHVGPGAIAVAFVEKR